MQTSSRNRPSTQRKSRSQQTNTIRLPAWLQPIIETASLYVLPVTLLILIALIALGISGNSAAHLEPGFSNQLAFEIPATDGAA
jgi:hypothetical protein